MGGTHGAARIGALGVDAYNVELRSGSGGFVGDRASKHAFRAALEDWRARLRRVGPDPLGEAPTEALDGASLDAILNGENAEAAALVHEAIASFASELATVVRRFLRLPAWRGTERILVGGGLRASRAGELAIGRAALLLKAEDAGVELLPVRHDPDHAALIGGAHLAPPELAARGECVLTADIGGTAIRAGLVALNLDRASDLAEAEVLAMRRWRHAGEKPGRDAAVDRLAAMLRELTEEAARRGHRLAPFVGTGCPGAIAADGAITRGGQNLPGDWEAPDFNLPQRLAAALGRLAGEAPVLALHNDAVVQGLSQAPFQQDVVRWGVLTIGTGLGNARFTRHPG